MRSLLRPLVIAVVISVFPVGSSAVGSEGEAANEHGHDSTEADEAFPADLQTRIDALPAGATLTVDGGRFAGPIRLRRPITLVGGGGSIIDGRGDGSVVRISSAGVTIRGFQIRGSGTGPIGSPSGIMIEEADGARVEDVRISDAYIGVTVRSSSDVVIDGLRIEGRGDGPISGELHAVSSEDEHHAGQDRATPMSVAPRGDGIWLWNAQRPVVRRSTIVGVRDGVYLSYGSGALLDDVTIEGSRYGIHDMYSADLEVRSSTLRENLSGCVVMYGGPVRLVRNTIVANGSPSTGFGVLIKDASDVVVAGNVVAANRVGVQIDDAGRTGGASARIVSNTVAVNQVGVTLFPSTGATFARNAFVENTMQVTLAGQGDTQARWAEDGVGNHWSNYSGFDADADGLGDVPHLESGRLASVLASDPMLLALASGPGFRLVSSVDQRWTSSRPVVSDPAPILVPPPPVPGAVEPGIGFPLAAAGIFVAGFAAWSVVRARHPSTGRAHA